MWRIGKTKSHVCVRKRPFTMSDRATIQEKPPAQLTPAPICTLPFDNFSVKQFENGRDS
jgi:hypothetical protein